ncbi:MAG TPA: YbjQ family protein [Lapillicoccus sp.]|nr:YbjQ family protein [Lapillicoccus sp.]
MLISTMNDLPGYDVTEVLGEVTGLTVRSRHIGSQLGAGFKSIVGGELKGLSKQLVQTREEAMDRLVEEATSRGADAILAMRFDANEIGQGYQEVVAYGTAVKISRRV